MKKIILGLLLICTTTISLFAYTVLTGEKNDGYTRTCYYLDGSVLTVSGSENCPLSN